VTLGIAGYSPQALSWSTRLVRAYADSGDGDVSAEVGAVLEEVGRDRAELRNLVASLAGLAGHAVRAVAVQREVDLGLASDPHAPLPRISDERAKVLSECADALRSWANARERRSGRDRRLAPDRRVAAPGSSAEQINLRLFGERRVGVPDRRSGADRRGFAATAPQETLPTRDRSRLIVPAHAGPIPRPRP
jgi:hypothetical protein